MGDQLKQNRIDQDIEQSEDNQATRPSYLKKIQFIWKIVWLSKKRLAMILITLLMMSISLVLLLRTYYLNTSVAELRVLSQVISRQISDTLTVNTPDAIERLENLQTQFKLHLDCIQNWSIDHHQLATLEAQWASVSKQIDFIVQQKKTVHQLYDGHIMMSEVIADIQTEYQMVINQIADQSISSPAIMLASNQMMLAQHILKSIDPAFLVPNFSTAYVDQLNRDMHVFVDNLNTQLNAKTVSGIRPVIDPQSKSILQNIQLAYDDVMQPATAMILANTDQIVQLQKIVHQAPDKMRQLSDDLTGLSPTVWHWILFSILMLVSPWILCYALFSLSYTKHQKNLLDDQMQHQHNQYAVMRLLDQITALTQVNLTVPMAVSENFTPPVAAAINTAIEQLHQFISHMDDQIQMLAQHYINAQNIMHQSISFDEHQSQKITDISIIINEMLISINQVVESIEESLFVSKRLSLAASDTAVIQGIMDHRQMADQKIQTILEHILSCILPSQDICQLRVFMDDIASQSNILAINTAIQANRSDQQADHPWGMIAHQAQDMTHRILIAKKQFESWEKYIQKSDEEIMISLRQSLAEVVLEEHLTQQLEIRGNHITMQSQQLEKLIRHISSTIKLHATSANHLAASLHGIEDIAQKKSSITIEITHYMAKLTQMTDLLQQLLVHFKQLNITAKV